MKDSASAYIGITSYGALGTCPLRLSTIIFSAHFRTNKVYNSQLYLVLYSLSL